MLIPAALSVLAACVILLFAPWISWLLFGSRTEIFPTAGLAIMLPFMVVAEASRHTPSRTSYVYSTRLPASSVTAEHRSLLSSASSARNRS